MPLIFELVIVQVLFGPSMASLLISSIYLVAFYSCNIMFLHRVYESVVIHVCILLKILCVHANGPISFMFIHAPHYTTLQLLEYIYIQGFFYIGPREGFFPPPFKLCRLHIYMYIIKQPTSIIF